jgi:predicted nucleic acid-binding protein
VITLDTSGLLALFDEKDSHHTECREVVREDEGPLLLSVGVLAEIAWLLETRFPPHVEREFLEDIRAGAYTLSWESRDIARIQALAQKYADLPLGISDSAVITCAERSGGRVLTMDWRHFPVARGEKSITVLPERHG